MGIKELKPFLNPVSKKLKALRSHDTNDHWIIQEVGFDEKKYSQATHVLLGCPQDEGVRRNNGRVGASHAPHEIRSHFYRLQSTRQSDVKLFDAGDISEISSLEETHEALTKTVSRFLKDGKTVIVLGGGNDISYADVRGLKNVEDDFFAINIDAHLDMRISDQMTSGTPYRKLIEDEFLKAEHFYEFGIRPESNASFYLKNAKKLGVNIHYLQDLLDNGATQIFQNILDEIGQRPFFLGLDMDSIRAADAPGVSASSPTGFSGQDVMQFIRLARRKQNLKLFEITEVNPTFDIDNQTSKLAAQFIYRFLFG